MKRFFINLLLCFDPSKKHRRAIRERFGIKKTEVIIKKEIIKKTPLAVTIPNDSPLLGLYISKAYQNEYNLSKEKKAKKLIIFVEPEFSSKTGGAVGRYNYYKNLKKIIDKDTAIIYTTEPGPYTYYKNDFFDNDLNYLRWEQARELMLGKEEVLLFLPMLELQHPITKKHTFRDNLNERDYFVFKTVKKLRVHINNGRMDMMPNRNIYAWFLAYTNDITTSVMHISSNTQMICNQIGTPLIYLPARIEAKYNTKIEFSKKEKLIIISPDLTFCNIEFKRKFIRKLNNEL